AHACALLLVTPTHHCAPSVSFPLMRPPPRPTLFPYTTLFRSVEPPAPAAPRGLDRDRVGRADGRADGVAAAERWVEPRHAAEERSEEHTSELQSLTNLVCRLLLEKKKTTQHMQSSTDHTTHPY